MLTANRSGPHYANKQPYFCAAAVGRFVPIPDHRTAKEDNGGSGLRRLSATRLSIVFLPYLK
jgi:hypothetical protein